MTEDQNNITPTEEVKEKVIGEFKPKRKFLNFVSAVNGLRIRLISDVAFIKGEALTGLGLDGVIFKVTICDEGTIKFEEVDTNITDVAYRKRLIDDICERDVTGYAKKYVVSDLECADKDGKKCYLEVEEAKPIDKLKSLFDEVDNKTEISDKGRSFLDELLGETSDEVVEVAVEIPVVETVAEVKEEKPALTMMEEAFRKMNEDKINELKDRVEEKEKEIKKANIEISQAETKIKTHSEQLRVLNTRLETLSPGDEPNGYVFLVSDEQKNETGLDETTRGIADKIADLMNLKKEVLFNYLTGGFYKIKIGKKGENDKKLESIDRDILEKILSIDPSGKISMSDTNEVEYRGELNWHQLTGKMIRKGFEQDPEFDKVSGSNSYEAKMEEDGKNWAGQEVITDQTGKIFIKVGEYKNIVEMFADNKSLNDAWERHDDERTIDDYISEYSDREGIEYAVLSDLGFDEGISIEDKRDYQDRKITVSKPKKSCSHDNCGCEGEEVKAITGVELAKEIASKTDTCDTAKELNKLQSAINKVSSMSTDEVMEKLKEAIPAEDKTKLLMSVPTPKDLVIVGMGINGKDTFSITDDYSGFDISIEGKKKFSLESDGFVSIIDVQEFLDFKKSDDGDELDFDSVGAVLLQNFSGDIRIGIIDENGKASSKFDLNDYICHQFDDHVDVIVDLPKGTNATVITEKNLVSLLRDGKINNILND